MKFRIYKRSIIYLMGSWIILAGCKASLTPFDNQSFDLPTNYTVHNDSTGNLATIDWKSFFEDKQLQALIEIALENNQEVQKTLERIRIAHANLKMARVGALPDINATAGGNVRRFGDYTMDGVGNADTNLSETVPDDKRIPAPYTDFVIGAEFNWELDVWGKYSNQKKAAAARWLSSQEMANSVKTWLIAEVADMYYKIIGIDEEIAILKRNINYQQVAFDLSQELKQSGRENQLGVDQFEAQLLNSQAILVQKQRELRTVELALKGLLGIYTEHVVRSPLADSAFSPEIVQTGIPSDLLRYRPDIRMVENELAASKADVAAARAAFFPSFRLFGMAGFNAFEFSRLFLSPGSSVYQLGAGLVAPIFNRNQIKSAFNSAQAHQKIAFLDYEEIVLQSYLEVLDRINSYATLKEQLSLKESEVLVQRRSVDNANTLFSVGYAGYLEVINSQNSALEAELEYVKLKTEQLQNIVSLYKALGGGWM